MKAQRRSFRPGAHQVAAAALVGLTLLLAAAFWQDWWPGLRGGYGWRWPYARPEPGQIVRLAPAMATLAIYAAGVYWLRHRSAWIYVGWCVAAAAALPVALLYYLGDPALHLLGRTITAGATGAFWVAVEMGEPLQALRDWPAWMVRAESISSHMAISPPGYPLLYGLVAQALGALPGLARWSAAPIRALQCHHRLLMALDDATLASAWVGMATPVAAALAAVPLYGLAQRQADRALACRAVALWPLIPSLGIFTGLLATPYPLLAVGSCALFARGLASRRALWLALAAIVLAVGVLLSISLLPLGLSLALWGLLEAWRTEPTRSQRLARLWSLAWPCFAGAALAAGLYTLVARHTPWDVFAASMQFHLGHIERPYWPWVVLHSWDYLLFFGPALTGLSLWGLRRAHHGAGRLSLAVWLTLFLLVISGTGRGETGRIWLFFMPLTLLSAAEALRGLGRAPVTALVAAQAVWLLVLAAVLRPVGISVTPAPRYAAPVTGAQALYRPLEAIFGSDLRLQGYAAEQEGDQLVLTLQWQAMAPLTEDYVFSALLVSPQGPLAAATDWRPLGGAYPTTCWHRAPQSEVVDRVALPLGEAPSAGAWWLSLSAYTLDAAQQPQRAPVCPAEGPCDDQVGLGPVMVATRED